MSAFVCLLADLFQDGVLAIRQKRYDKAAQLFTKQLQAEENQLARFFRGNAYESLGRADDALSDYASIAGVEGSLADKARSRLYDICNSYCHLNCSDLPLLPAQLHTVS